MTNVESMDYTHSHPSTLLATLVPRNFRRYHTPTIYLPQNTTRKRPTNGAPNLAINGALVVRH